MKVFRISGRDLKILAGSDDALYAASMKVFRISGRDQSLTAARSDSRSCLNESLPHKRKRLDDAESAGLVTAAPQ